jgi:hypothetical protein
MVNKNDTNLIQVAFKDYLDKGSGKFRDQAERVAFKTEVFNASKAPMKTTSGTRVVGSVNKEERCNSGQVENSSLGEDTGRGTKVVRSIPREKRCNSTYVEATMETNIEDITMKEPEEGTEEVGYEGCVIIETYNAHGVTKAPSPLTHSSLHLMVASKVEPPSRTEIRAFLEKKFEETISRRYDEDNGDAEDGTGCWVLMEMTYGAEYIVPYKVVHGKILADTGSTTTLINEDFAIKQGLDIRSITTGQIILRDVNDGTSELTKQCFLRITVTTVEGELISFTVLAFCTDKLKQDILLGTRDLERYKIDVSSHRGEAKMELNDGTVAFPMLDTTQITHLQHLASGVTEEC